MLGITSSTESHNGYSDGVGFVIPSNTVRPVVAQLVAGRKVVPGYFGASLEDSTSPLGARLVIVPSAGPSAHAGMKPGDVVTSIDGILVASAQQMIGLTKAHLSGDTISVVYTRGGKSHTIKITLGTRPAA